jgi:UDP-N-acetyl-D-glucosamine dehydrogenase
MPDYVVRRIVASLNERSLAVKGQRILLLGLAYKPNTADCRESPARNIAEQLLQMGAEVAVADSWVDPGEMPAGVQVVDANEAEASAAVLTVLLVDHDGPDYPAIQNAATAVFDTRHKLSGDNVEHL